MACDPCDECVVRPSCKVICPTKENYGVWLRMSLRQLRSSFRLYVHIPTSIRNQVKLFEERLHKHDHDIARIVWNEKGERPYKNEHQIHPPGKFDVG